LALVSEVPLIDDLGTLEIAPSHRCVAWKAEAATTIIDRRCASAREVGF
jgi:hypothetical protein